MTEATAKEYHCPKCDAEPGDDCRTSGGRWSSTHKARFTNAANHEQIAREAEAQNAAESVAAEDDFGDQLVFELQAAAADGRTVPIKVEVSYPAGYGLYAAQMLEQLGQPDQRKLILDQLIAMQDQSVIDAVLAARPSLG